MSLRERLGLPPGRTDNLPPDRRPVEPAKPAAPIVPEWVRLATERKLPAVDRTGPTGR